MTFGSVPVTIVFQSTLSVRRATAADGDWRDGDVISIHALREESDAGMACRRLPIYDFNPRSP